VLTRTADAVSRTLVKRRRADHSVVFVKQIDEHEVGIGSVRKKPEQAWKEEGTFIFSHDRLDLVPRVRPPTRRFAPLRQRPGARATRWKAHAAQRLNKRLMSTTLRVSAFSIDVLCTRRCNVRGRALLR
tara:strand:- start:124 stop:510 length:387 start_codon:yes stop_codon:yes gene_type:complete